MPETRADMETLPDLVAMYELGQSFIEDEVEDASDQAAMQEILTRIEALIEAEAAEPSEVLEAARDFESLRVKMQVARPTVAPELKRVVLAPLTEIEVRDSKAGKGQMTVAGHAAVFNRLSHDLGGFREKIAPGAFTGVLDGTPDVHFVWDHDTSLVLARTTNKTLELREDPLGLHFWARVAPTSYAADLRVLLERKDVDQASFAFTIAEDTWHADEDENVTRTITRVGELFDVSVVAQGAYPQTDSSLREVLQEAIAKRRLPSLSAAGKTVVAARDDGTEAPQGDLAATEESVAAPSEVADASEALRDLRSYTRVETSLAKKRLLDAERKAPSEANNKARRGS